MSVIGGPGLDVVAGLPVLAVMGYVAVVAIGALLAARLRL